MIEESDILSKLELKKGQYYLVSAHREENIGSEINFMKLVDILNHLAETERLPIVVSTHPRTQKMIEQKNIKFHKNIMILKPLGFIAYNNLQINSKAVLSDSGTISEESSILGFNALNLREAHERPEAMEKAAVMMVGVSKDRILQGLKVLETPIIKENNFVDDYSEKNVSEKVLKIIVSYTDYINHKVWKKYV